MPSDRARRIVEDLWVIRHIEDAWETADRHLSEHAADVIRWLKEKDAHHPYPMMIGPAPDATGDSTQAPEGSGSVEPVVSSEPVVTGGDDWLEPTW